jgi:CheY-like chemotaxis protein/anti-sigma regulatory factor (Ser/Thr protein kinase)
MDVSRIESGTIRLDASSVELTSLLDEVVELVASQAATAGVVLQRLYRSELGAVVVADRLRLRQALLNLASNAVKYNRAGGDVSFSTSVREGRVTITIEDTGMGMSAVQLAHLYEPFNRLGRELSGIEGTGIGLALCRQLVELMGGDIRIASVEGRGTTASVSIQGRAAGAAWADPVATSDSLVSPLDDSAMTGTVLYIEDNDVNVFIIQSLLARWPGIRFLHASDGLAGLHLAREHQPDLILLDMNLPEMHGMEVLDALQANEATRRVTVFALSADALDESSQLALQHGATAYLTKPIAFDVFLDRIRSFFARHPSESMA